MQKGVWNMRLEITDWADAACGIVLCSWATFCIGGIVYFVLKYFLGVI